MKPHRIIITVLCLILGASASGWAQDMDAELSNLATQLAGKVKDQNKKKVAVLDFTDLQGTTSGELGKYIAEQLTVDMVMEKRDFSVLDRANLKKILTEHKLTATGLVDPDNAKKLGQFAGVDALIMGTIIPKGNNISLTAKIITTDTAEIVGAAKAQFKNDETSQQLVAKPATPDATDPNEASNPAKKPFGDLQTYIESIKLLPGDNIYGFARLTLIITNTSSTAIWGVGLANELYRGFNLSNDRGDEFKTTDISGIEFAFANRLTTIPPKGSIKIIAKSQVRWTGRPGEYRPYHFQTDVIFGQEVQGRYPDTRKCSLVMDVK